MMFGNVSAERKAIETLYDAECTVFRAVSETDNFISAEKSAVIAENIPCGLSNVRDSSFQEDCGRIIAEKELFTAPEADIKPGDTVTVTAYGRTTEYKATGEPMVYATHQQVRLLRRDLA